MYQCGKISLSRKRGSLRSTSGKLKLGKFLGRITRQERIRTLTDYTAEVATDLEHERDIGSRVSDQKMVLNIFSTTESKEQKKEPPHTIS